MNREATPQTPPRVDLRRTVRAVHRALRDGEGQSSLVERFDELTKLLYCKIHDENGRGLAVRGSVFSVRPGDTPSSIAARVRAAFERQAARAGALFPPRFARLRMADATIARAVELLAPVRLSDSGQDPKGLAYEEVIRGTFDKGDHQQFFTPRPVVEFMVDLLGPLCCGTVCDPACGTGGFLLYAGAALNKRTHGPRARLVGLEIDERLAWAARMNLDMHGVSRFEVHHLAGAGSLGPGLSPWLGQIDVVLTNPPFGSDLADPDALAGFELGRGRASRRRGVLFVERCLDLVRPDGLVAIVLDEGVLAGPSNADVRELVLDRADPLAVVGLPETAFMPYASVRTSILLLRRKNGARRAGHAGRVFFARAETVGRKPNGDPLVRLDCESGRYVLDSDLPAILEAWQARRASASPVAWLASLPRQDAPVFQRDGHRLDTAYHHPARHEAARALAASPHPIMTLGQVCDVRNEAVLPARDLAGEEIVYVGLANIAPRYGTCQPSLVHAGSLKSGVKRCLAGDILFARLRPELRKVWLVGPEIGEGYASPECLVLVPKREGPGNDPLVLPELLAVMLRSDLVFGQLLHLVIGIGRPRLSRAAVLGVRLPVAPLAVQRRLWRACQRAQVRAAARSAAGERALREAAEIAARGQAKLVDGLLGRAQS